MKYAFTAAALFAFASAQDFSSIPGCAQPCLQSAIATTSCQMTDYKCICNDVSAIQSAGTSCVVDKCGADVAVSQVVPALKAFCAKALAAPAAAMTAYPESSPAAPAPAPAEAKDTTCTEEEATSTPAPMSIPTTTTECTTESTPVVYATSTPEAMSTSSVYPESSSVCEEETPAASSSYAAESAPAPATATASVSSYPVGTYGSSPVGTTPIVQAGGNCSTSGVSPKQPVATAGASSSTVAGSVGAALAAFALAALAI
ncbi:hypothetical protein PG988_011183 [Apiospora saccharicola]